MPTSKEILAERVVARIAELGLTDREVSIAVTGKPDLIRDIKRRGSMPSGETMLKLAARLETTTDWLVGRSDNKAQIVSEVTFHELAHGWRGTSEPGVPLLGTAFCDDLIVVDGESGGTVLIERFQLDVDHVVRMVERPSMLWNAVDAYAILFQGSSMERRYYQGDIGFVDPRRPPSPGQVGLFQLTDGENDGIVTALAKELVRVTSNYVELLQYNPEMTFRIPRKQVASMHRIFRPDELINI